MSELLIIGGPHHGEVAHLQELEWADGRLEIVGWYGMSSCARIVQSSVAATRQSVLAMMTNVLKADGLVETLKYEHRAFLVEILGLS